MISLKKYDTCMDTSCLYFSLIKKYAIFVLDWFWISDNIHITCCEQTKNHTKIYYCCIISLTSNQELNASNELWKQKYSKFTCDSKWHPQFMLKIFIQPYGWLRIRMQYSTVMLQICKSQYFSHLLLVFLK